VLTYAGALLPGNYQISPADVALGLGAAAVAMLPGTFTGRRHSARATPGQLTALTVLQGGAVIVLGAARSTVTLTLAVLAVMAFVNGWRSMVASRAWATPPGRHAPDIAMPGGVATPR
jgi:hypothetical protein